MRWCSVGEPDQRQGLGDTGYGRSKAATALLRVVGFGSVVPEELKIAQDSRNLELSELAERYESVRTHVARLTKPGYSVLLIPQAGTLFAEVENVGSDYVLVKLLGDEYRRQVVSSGPLTLTRHWSAA